MVMMRDAATVEWQMETGTTSFNVYRAGMPGLVDPDHDGAASSYGMCLASTLAGPALADAASPAPGAAFLYHVTSRGPGGESGLGNASSGAPRPNTSPCP
ncbi:MAG TPA: hypothetical protein VGS03_09470 [Candidatus Polarisedimenticolia bacterium]|nr:hypothetical protein [Candidatus Polarisedimenticolia bacterium]